MKVGNTPSTITTIVMLAAFLISYLSVARGDVRIKCPANVKTFSSAPRSSAYYECEKAGDAPVLRNCPGNKVYWPSHADCIGGDNAGGGNVTAAGVKRSSPSASPASPAKASESSDIKSERMPVLGRVVYLGDLYDAARDEILPGMSLWNADTLESAKRTSPLPTSKVDIVGAETIDDKMDKMDISASLKLSFMSGLISVEGSAGYLRDSSDKQNVVSIMLKYRATTHSETIPSYTPIDNEKLCELVGKGPTHVVSTIIYGLDANFVFKKEVSDTSSKDSITGSLKVAIKAIPGFSVSGSASVDITGEEKDVMEETDIKLYGDFILEKQPNTYKETIAIYQKLTTFLGAAPAYDKAAKTRIHITPITRYCDKSVELVDVGLAVVNEVSKTLSELATTKDRATALATSEIAQKYIPLKRILQHYLTKLEAFDLSIKDKIQKLLPKIRAGKGGSERKLIAITSNYSNSDFELSTSRRWLNDKELEINLIKFIINPESYKTSNVVIMDFEKANDIAELYDKRKVVVMQVNILSDPDTEIKKGFPQYEVADTEEEVEGEVDAGSGEDIEPTVETQGGGSPVNPGEKIEIHKKLKNKKVAKTENKKDVKSKKKKAQKTKGKKGTKTKGKGKNTVKRACASDAEWYKCKSTIGDLGKQLVLFKQFSEANTGDNQFGFVFMIGKKSEQGGNVVAFKAYDNSELVSSTFKCPAKPKNVAVDSYTHNSVTFKLDNPGNNDITALLVRYYKEMEGAATTSEHLVKRTDFNTDMTIEIAGLEVNRRYKFRMHFVSRVGNSQLSEEVGLTTRPSSAPRNLRAQPEDGKNADYPYSKKITWGRPEEIARLLKSNTIKYNVMVHGTAADKEYKYVVETSQTKAVIANLKAGKKYKVTVETLLDIEVGDIGNPITVRTKGVPASSDFVTQPEPPYGPVLSMAGDQKATISWEAPKEYNTGATILQYDCVLVKTTDTVQILVQMPPNNLRICEFTALTADTAYHAKIRVKLSDGEFSEYSKEFEFRTTGASLTQRLRNSLEDRARTDVNDEYASVQVKVGECLTESRPVADSLKDEIEVVQTSKTIIASGIGSMQNLPTEMNEGIEQRMTVLNRTASTQGVLMSERIRDFKEEGETAFNGIHNPVDSKLQSIRTRLQGTPHWFFAGLGKGTVTDNYHGKETLKECFNSCYMKHIKNEKQGTEHHVKDLFHVKEDKDVVDDIGSCYCKAEWNNDDQRGYESHHSPSKNARHFILDNNLFRTNTEPDKTAVELDQ